MEAIAEVTAAVKNVPALRFPEFEGEWENTTLGDFLTFKNGVNADKEKYGSGYRFINVMDIINNRFITHDKIIGSVEISEKEFEKNEVKYGDILFQRSSETREEVGQSNVYLDKNRSATFGGFVIRGQATKEYNPMFMHYLLKTDFARKEITTKSGGSTRYNVGQETLRQVNVIIPSIPEQQKIASFLSAADDKIQQLSKKKALLEKYKKGVMQQIFSQQIRFMDDSGNDFPEWEKKELSNLAKIMYGKDQKQVQDEDGKYPILGTGGLMGRTNSFLYDKPSVLIGRKGTIDKPVYIDTPFWTVDTLFYTEVLSNTFPKWLYYKFQTINWKLYNEASGVPSLSTSTIYKIKIDLPTIAEQIKIASFLTSIDDKINYTSNQLEQAQQFKKGLLQQLFV